VPNWSSISSDLGVFRRVRVLGAEEAALVVTIVAAHGGLAVLGSWRIDAVSTRAGHLG